ncbi:sulfite exporter TauE/SafE family protein [Thiomicrospira sp.]|uniref:sulfite exporter TauE/SafE family protein n=1 Tax=Thiomicrospira sp. TaxID=935 RepID=UPI0025FF7AB8|nr:sulfite exporter TauE/SafE family protein [Thiomicrospira sp.]
MKLAPAMLNRVVFGLLIALALIMFWEHLVGFGETGTPLFQQAWLQALVGLLAGLVVGIVAAVLGVAGGELLIPIIVILWGIDIKTAGSLSLLVSLPTMLVGFFRYRQAQAFDALRRERDLLIWMSVGSIAGALVGGLMLGLVPAQWLGLFLAVLLLISAWKVFKH